MIVQDKFGRRINTDLMICDNCKKQIAIKGIKLQEIQAGEYQVRYFSCPYCGHKFQAGTTDQKQREIIRQQQIQVQKIKLGQKKHWQKQTIEKFQQEMLRLTDQARGRNSFLSKIGERLLVGEELMDILNSMKEGAGNGTI